MCIPKFRKCCRVRRSCKIGIGSGFTMIELLTVIALISMLTAMIVGMAGPATSKMRIARIQAELSNISTAIDYYRNWYKVYPPDNQTRINNSNPYSGLVEGCSATNQLLLELSGCILTNNAFYSPYVTAPNGQSKTINQGEMEGLFGMPVEGILNANAQANKVRNFIDNYSERKLGRMTNAARSLVFRMFRVPAPAPYYQAGRTPQGKEWRKLPDNPWHYNSSAPTNNPGKYDLWAEFQLMRQDAILKDEQGRQYIEYYVIGNWNDMKPEIRREYF